MNNITLSGNESDEIYAAIKERKATFSLFLSLKENVYNQLFYSLNKLLRHTYKDAMYQIFQLVIPFSLIVHDKPKGYWKNLIKETKIFSILFTNYLYFFSRNRCRG